MIEYLFDNEKESGTVNNRCRFLFVLFLVQLPKRVMIFNFINPIERQFGLIVKTFY